MYQWIIKYLTCIKSPFQFSFRHCIYLYDAHKVQKKGIVIKRTVSFLPFLYFKVLSIWLKVGLVLEMKRRLQWAWLTTVCMSQNIYTCYSVVYIFWDVCTYLLYILFNPRSIFINTREKKCGLPILYKSSIL